MATNPYAGDYDDLVRTRVVDQLKGPARLPGWMNTPQVDKWYQEYLGRTPGEADYQAHAANPYGMGGIYNAVLESPERRNRPATTTETTPPPGTDTGTLRPSGQQRTGWGYNSPTGGSQEFSYTDTAYEGDYGPYQGFRDLNNFQGTEQDYNSAKYVVARAARGLGTGPEGFDEAALDQLVARLNAQGIPAQKVDAYQIDLGNGEGPIQVRHSSNQLWWHNRAGEGGTAPAATSPAPTGMGTTGANLSLGGDAQANIQAMLQELIDNGYPRAQLIQMLNPQG